MITVISSVGLADNVDFFVCNMFPLSPNSSLVKDSSTSQVHGH